MENGSASYARGGERTWAVFAAALLFALLAIGNIAGNAAIIHFAGWIGLICGASAIYLAMGEVLNEQFGRTVLPIGESH